MALYLYNVLIVFIMKCKTLLLLLRWDTGEVRGRFGGMDGFKGGLMCKGWVNIVIINVITEINYKCNYMQVFLKYKYNVKTSGGPLSALTCCVNARLLSAIKKISPLIYSQSWDGSWVYTTQAMMTFILIF